MPFEVRPASASDLAQLTDIYNHYILHTPVTFDLQPFTAEQRLPWYEAHAGGGAHRLVVAEDRGTLVGYASTSLFRVKPAYATTVEASVYVRPEAVGRGVGRALYAKLFEDVAGEDVNRIVAGIVLPNDASVKLHQEFGFVRVGVFSANGRKFERFWDVLWMERPLRLPGRA